MIFAIERFEQTPPARLYARVKRLVVDAIASGELKPGDAVPGERDIAQNLSVSRVTVRKAFAELVAEGVLQQRQGSGTFIAERHTRIELPLSRLTSFSEDMALRGLVTDSEWLSRTAGLPTPEEAIKLAISPGDSVARFHRLRRAGGEPMAIELAVIPRAVLPDPDAVETSLYAALDRLGMRPVRALQRLHATALAAREAKLLNLPAGSPALFIERVSYLPDGRVVEFTRSHYRGDSYDFVAELSLAPGSRQ